MAVACCLDECSNLDCVQLTEREFSVCNLICSSDGPVNFGTLKEATALHQELVSRIVRRLMVHGLVEKTDAGYLGRCGQ
jgi:predicted transcriptional regulator